MIINWKKSETQLMRNFMKDDSCETDIRILPALATSAMIRLHVIWNSRHIYCKLKRQFILVLSVLTYGCEAWTINAAMQKKLQTFENIFKKAAHHKISGKRMNAYIKEEMIAIICKYDPQFTHARTT